MAKREKYIQKQKERFAAKVNETQKFDELYEMARQSEDLDILEDFLGEVDKRSEFLNDVWMVSTKDRKKLFEFASKIGIQELQKRYTPELANKIEVLKKQGIVKNFDIMMLVNMNEGVVEPGMSIEEANTARESQAEKISYLLDIFTNPELEVGIHRTGGVASGEDIQKNGLYLTGHISSGTGINLESEDIKMSLAKNVSFFDGSIGVAISGICKGGHYKNYYGKEDTDIVLVGIPKEDIQNETATEKFIKSDSRQPTLDPKYILGYVNVNNKNNTINQIVSDYKPKKKDEVALALEQLKTGTIEITQEPEYHSIKNRFFGFLNKIMGKNHKEIQKEDEQTK